MNRVIHLIPYDGTGGVEVAARSMRHLQYPDLEFSVQSIYSHVPGYQERQVTYGPRPLLDALLRIRREPPDLLIVSLWRACIVGMLVKLLQPRVRLILMLHSTKHAHWLDRLVTTATGYVADEWWGDSSATVNGRLAGSPQKPKRVISFVTRKLQPVASASVTPHFVFWGRISAIKGIDRAIHLYAAIAQHHPDASFTIIGPDGGAVQELQALVNGKGLQGRVALLGEMDITQIRKEAAQASFYLQASKYEGMAMSVVEAMQLGLVPVVTPVGEIRNYCRQGENAVLIQSDEAAVSAILGLLSDPVKYQSMQSRAQATWQGNVMYADSMLGACRVALSSSSARAQ